MYHFDVHRRDASRNSSSDGRTSHQDCTAVVELWALAIQAKAVYPLEFSVRLRDDMEL